MLTSNPYSYINATQISIVSKGQTSIYDSAKENKIKLNIK